MGKVQRFTFFDLVFCNLKRRPFRTAALAVLVSILSFVLFSGSLISLSLKNGTDGLSKRLGADILVVPKGYEQKTENVLLRGDPSTFYMDAAWTEKIAAAKGVRAASPQLFVASLNADCCSTKVQIIGFDQKTDFTVEPWIKSALPGALSIDEVVVGADVAGKVGGKLRFFDRDYVIAAKMDSTGTGFDTSVFMSFEAAERAKSDYTAKSGRELPKNAVSSVTVLLEDGYSAGDVAENISGILDKNKISLIVSQKIMSSVSGNLRATVRFVTALAALLWVLSVLVLGIVFSAVLNERKREFGILRSLGATRKKLSFLVLWESGILSLLGGVLGMAISALFLFPFQTLIQRTISMPYLQPSFWQFFAVTAASLVLSFAVGPISSLASVFKISGGDAYSVIREGDV
jgi:ABC-type transport system, involved in lipoprotein release, permease component